MTDFTRLITSLKRRSAHVKEFGDDITFIKLEDLDALVEALEKAQGMEAYWKTQCRGITDHCEELQVRIAELESSGIASGILRCTECSFVQTKNNISITPDAIVIGNSKPEPCPNGCGPLQPVTEGAGHSTYVHHQTGVLNYWKPRSASPNWKKATLR